MYANLNPNAVGIRTASFEQLAELAARCGFGGVDVPLAALEDDRSADAAGAVLRRLGLRGGLFPLPANFFSTQQEFDSGLARLSVIAPRAARIGVVRTYDHIWSGSNDLVFAENWPWHVERLKVLVEMLGRHGIRMGIEFLGPKTLQDGFAHPFIRTLEQAIELTDAVGAGLGIVLDTFHWYCSGGTLDQLRSRLDGRRIVNVHLNDARADRQRDEQLDMERAMPLETGVIDAAAVVRVLHEKGYDGPVIVEPFQPAAGRFSKLPSGDAASQVAASLRELFDRAGISPTVGSRGTLK
jgi:sugar phosphate isomerase/epimerase